MGNSNLSKAKAAKNDEFYTIYSDVEAELSHYWDHLKGKTVYCNCDDPRYSNIYKYLSNNFSDIGLKRLITTYKTKDGSNSYKRVKYEGENLEEFRMSCDGDFRSIECQKILEEVDVVITNPPFSLFREYVAQLVEYDKKFIAIGNMNAITYKEIFPLIKENRLRLGYTSPSEFKSPSGILTKKVSGLTRWYTNLNIKKRHEDMILYKEYTPEEYPKYDNYDAINVDKVAEIPKDYYEAIGVPITFLDKYNPEQFEIVKFRKGNDEKDLTYTVGVPTKQHGLIKDKEAAITLDKPISAAKKKDLAVSQSVRTITPYFRIIIKRKM